jgi:putative ABC transport system ATP-binding protein
VAQGDRLVFVGPLSVTPNSSPDEAVVEARELYRFFHAGDDEVLALRGVSLAARAGELVAVLGPSGSGKSTLLGCLSGLEEPDGGSVRIGGTVMSRRPGSERAELRARHIGIVLQTGNLIEHLKLSANLKVAHKLARGRDRPDVEGALSRVGLAGRAAAYPAQLSGGEAVRAGLAVAMINRPPLVIADEPTAEVDRATEDRLLALLRAEADRGTALIVATHSPNVAGAADRVLTMVDGRISA